MLITARTVGVQKETEQCYGKQTIASSKAKQILEWHSVECTSPSRPLISQTVKFPVSSLHSETPASPPDYVLHPYTAGVRPVVRGFTCPTSGLGYILK